MQGQNKSKKIARVFPRKTKATPDDDLCFFGPPPLLNMPEVDEVHISVTFTYDKPIAQEMYGAAIRRKKNETADCF